MNAAGRSDWVRDPDLPPAVTWTATERMGRHPVTGTVNVRLVAFPEVTVAGNPSTDTALSLAEAPKF